MNDLKTAVRAAGNNAEYDAAVKGILADKQVLAWILKGATTEYSAMSIERIIPLIDEPSVSKIAVNPGLTNSEDSFITGMPQESNIKNEGVRYYDIRFSVRNPYSDGKKNFHIIVDLEAQKEPNPGYDIVTRGIFYCGRMLSEQSGRNFKEDDYDAINKVYSIWLCFNSPIDTANTISRYRIAHEAVYGNFRDDSRHDMLQVIMVRLPNTRDHDKATNSPSELHEMLYDLIVSQAEPDEKIETLKNKYGLKMNDQKGRINTMCNLSEGIYDEGYKDGKAIGIEQGKASLILSMLQKGKAPEDIHDYCGIPLDEILKVKATMKTDNN